MANNVEGENKDEDILNVMQKFGKYQIMQYVFISLPTMFTAMNYVNYVFVAGDIDYRCRIPECDIDNTYSVSWWPKDLNRCSRPNINLTNFVESQCTNNSFTSSVSECTEWIYGSNDTIVSWLDLACNPWKTNFVGTVHSLGMVLGMTIGGWCSDKFGRKPTLIAASIGIVFGTLKTFMKTYYAYVFIELVEATLSGAAFAAGMILIIEISSNDKRVLSGVVYAYAIYTGEAMLGGIAFLFPYWKVIIYILCTPTILFISYIRLLNESPRWLVLNDKLEEARNTLKLIIKLNNLNICRENVAKIDKEKLQQLCNIEVSTEKEGYKEVFKSIEMIKRLVVAVIARFSVTLTYYALVANSVWLSGNRYINFVVAAIMSFPGDLLALYFMDKIGRKQPLIYGYFVCGVSCFALGFVPDSLLWLKLLLFLLAKLIVTACYTGIWAYTMELFPTSVRGSLFGLCTFAASAGWLLAPLTPAMETISPVFVYILLGCSAIAASFALTLTPETKDLPLLGTIEEAVNRVAAAKIESNNKKTKNKINFVGDESYSVHL